MDRVAVSHVRLDRERVVSELGGKLVDPVGTAGKERHAVTGGDERPGCSFADARGRTRNYSDLALSAHDQSFLDS
jgi:hypothetical protein